MDPPHITEFASERYFSKLKQLGESSNSQDVSAPPEHAAPPPPPPFPTQSPFILPLRESKAGDTHTDFLRPQEQKKPEKTRLFSSLRSKGSFFHSAKPPPTPQLPPELPRTLVTESVLPKSTPFDQQFLALPNELQIQIVASLPLRDILNLRMTSKSWHALITVHEGPIVRYHLERHVPAYANRLYPVADPAKASLHHLCGLWHRLHVAAKLSYLMCEWITKEIFLRNTETQRLEFAPQRERMRRRLIPLVFTVFHFFEKYREFHLQHIMDHDGHGLHHEPYTLNPVEAQIMNMYDDQTLLRVHEAFPLVISSFCRRLRPPTYVGRVERSLRGYLREKPPDEVHVAILCLGGMRQVEKLWEIKGYNLRRSAVDSWYSAMTKEPVEAAAKSKRGLLGLGRKKSSVAMREAMKTTGTGTETRSTPPQPSNLCAEYALPHRRASDLIFRTSLSAGMPMGPLTHEQVRSLLSDLPLLQQIWHATAEATILDRRIVERAQDIKRNQQVMMDLIREDGIDEEDEWWYGRGSPESVRPPQEAIEDDPIEGVTA